MAKFKVGDKVKIVGNPCGIGPKMMGQECTVERLDYNDDDKVRYYCRGERHEGWWYPESSLEAVKNEPLFKVGDTVKIVGRSSFGYGEYPDAVVKVKYVDEHDSIATYACDTGDGNTWFPRDSVAAIAAVEVDPADYLRKLLARNEELEATVIALEARLASVKAALA